MAATEIALSAIVLPDRDPISDFLADVLDAESAGVRTVWTYDHLSWPMLRENPWYGCIPLLAAAAAVTSTVRLGPQVLTPNFRHPVPLAKELMTLDRLSGGRLDIGIGAGTEGPDAGVLGEPPYSRAERTARYLEWTALLDELLTHGVTTVDGERYRAVEAHQLPGCVQRPRAPFTVAGAGPKALGAVAQYGQAWVTYGPYGPEVDEQAWFAGVEQQSTDLSRALERAGRAPDSIGRIAQFGIVTRWPFASAAKYRETLDRLSAIGFTESSVHWPRPDGRGLTRAELDIVTAAHA